MHAVKSDVKSTNLNREYKVTLYVKQITLKVQMSPSPPKHRKLIAQARDKSMRPSTSGWSKLTSRKYVCCQMLQVSLSCSFFLSPSAVRHVTYNIVGLHKERLGASLVVGGERTYTTGGCEGD